MRQKGSQSLQNRFDVVVIGAGLSGLTLARHLLLDTSRTVLLLDKRSEPAAGRQKVGESLVQVGGYYFSKILDLQEHLLRKHYLKYNLRFYWKTPGRSNAAFEDYSQAFIRLESNIPTFQLDRNALEDYLLEQNRAHPNFRFSGTIRSIDLHLSENEEDHRIVVDGSEVRCRWVVDASGRSGVLRRRLSLGRRSPIHHNATFCWVEGLVDIEKLTGRSAKQVRLDSARRKTGNFPFFLATNHFCAEGQWFWVIALHGKTSLGLVYDPSVVPAKSVATAGKMINYVCQQWPLLARDLPNRKILQEGCRVDYACDVQKSLSDLRWALIGDAGRFSDPLYSPGSDLISLYNTLIVDAIQTEDPAMLEEKCSLYEQIMRVMYEAYLPSYALSYNCLGDQETFILKYSWELSIYFGFYVLPFINDLIINPEFMRATLRKFSLLGPINLNLHKFLSAFAYWKKAQPAPSRSPLLFDLFDISPLRASEKLFYEIGLSPEETIGLIDCHLDRLEEMARYIFAHVHASVLGKKDALLNGALIDSFVPRNQGFDPMQMQAAYTAKRKSTSVYRWKLNPLALEPLLAEQREPVVGH